jgi:hypothetical protein
MRDDMTVKRREGITMGQPPKYLNHEDDLYKVVGITGDTDGSGKIIYECECKSCGGTHQRSAQHLQRKSRSRECPNYRSHNWSGLDREDAIMQRKYGISMTEYGELLEFQGGSCALCQKPLERLSRRINIDHDHNTNQVRGLLCTGCNTGLGHLGDDIAGLERALYYLKNTPFDEFKYTNAR